MNVASIKKRKVLMILLIISVIAFIGGVLFISVLSDVNQETVKISVGDYFTGLNNNKLNYFKESYSILSASLILFLFIWIMGISIIGSIIIAGILAYKSFLVGFSFTSIIYTYGVKGIGKAVLYCAPEVLNLFMCFFLCYYAISFSLLLFNYLFRKKEYNKLVIMKRYLKVLVVIILWAIVFSLIKTFIVPTVLKVF